MKFARVTGRAYGRYRLTTYDCKACEVSYTEAEADGDEAQPSPARD